MNLLLPFTNPQTPLLQDLIHTVILCGTLYYIPQITDAYHAYNTPLAPHPADDAEDAQDLAPEDDDGLAHPPEMEVGEDIDFLPRAPAPPPPRVDDEEGEWQNPDDFANVAAEDDAGAGVGPANPAPRAVAANRTIGTKKAKSIARRDQRRAYHEFQRSQAEQRRAAEAHGREEREAALASEKARRAEEERRIAEKQRLERERKKEEERREAEEERERRERAVERVREDVVKKGAADLVGLAVEEGKDRMWIERLVRASGIVAQMENDLAGSKIMITGEGWMVRVDRELMTKAYADAVAFGDRKDGRVSFEEFGEIVERAVMARAKMAA